MIDISNTMIAGLVPALNGMRNSFNSHDKSDTDFYDFDTKYYPVPHRDDPCVLDDINIGENDKKLCMKLAQAGGPHAKFRRMIIAWVDINAPFLWWKEYDTYKIGTTANSESTMHNVLDKPFSIDNFTATDTDEPIWDRIIYALNGLRDRYLEAKADGDKEIMNKCWRTIIETLPSGYMQKRTLCLNYEVLRQIYKYRKNHKLYEWDDMCDWIESLPYSELITLKEDEEDEN